MWLRVGSTGMAPFFYSTTHPRPVIFLCVTFLAGNGHPIPPNPSALRYGITQHCSRTNGEADEAIRIVRVWLRVGSTGMAPFFYSTTHPRPVIFLCVTFLAGNGHPIPPNPSALRYGITQHSLTLASPWPFIFGITSLIGLP